MTMLHLDRGATAGPDRPVTGSAMDRSVENRRLVPRMKIGLAAAALIVLAMLFRLYALRGNSQEVAQDRLTISEVSDGSFRDFIPLRAGMTPLLTVCLNAIEGGRVEQVVAEDGAMLRKGDLIAVLSKPELRLSVLARQTEVEQQINNMRSQELAQTRLANERSAGGAARGAEGPAAI